MDTILSVAQKRNIPVIEDAAQSIGAEYKGRKAGSMGRIGILSFFPSKNLGGAGDGGMVLTNDRVLYEKIMVLRVHGSKPKYYHRIVGGNFRLDALQAAILNVKLKYLDGWSRRRQANADYYGKKLKEKALTDKGIIKTPLPVYQAGGDKNYHIYNQYTIRAKERDRLQAFLKEAGIGTEIYYPVPLHLQECYKGLGYKKGDFPAAEEAARSVLSLPIYPELTGEQKDYVVEKTAEFYRT
jgi:dTDP-4-amino-4,6-dideoxygalactose transaminase